MKKIFLLQDNKAGKFYTDSGRWTSDETSALPFEDLDKAKEQQKYFLDDYGNTFVDVYECEKWY